MSLHGTQLLPSSPSLKSVERLYQRFYFRASFYSMIHPLEPVDEGILVHAQGGERIIA
jgi:hypothetical protein